MSEPQDTRDYIGLAAKIVAAYVRNHSVPVTDLSKLIDDVHQALLRVAHGPGARGEPPKPAVSPKRSVMPEYIVCLEDGKRFKSLRRHLRSRYGMTPQQYREKWSLPADYPMVAPNYAAKRSALAKKMGLGRQPARRK